MLPSVRNCAGQKVKSLPVASSDQVSFTEPLLFLYPRWFQVASYEQQYRCLHTCQRPRPRISKRQARVPVTIRTVPARSKSSNIHAHAKNTVNDQNSKLSSPIAVSSDKDARGLSSTSKDESLLRREVLAEIGRDDQSAGGSKGKKHGSSRFIAPDVDGLELMRLLSKVPSRRIPRWHESRRYSTKFIKWLTGTLEKNTWIHKDGRGCEIEIVPPTDDDPEHCQLLLYGSSESQEMALRYLKDQVVQFSLKAFETPRSSKNQGDRVKCGGESSSLGQHCRVDEIKIPSLWTIRTFYEYVTSIVHHQAPRTIERILYPRSESYNQVAGKILKNLFADPHLRHCHSLAALRQALLFFKSRTELAPEALRVWIEAYHSGIVPDISCFNSEIERCLSVKNVARVQYLLFHMAKMSIPPDIDTWCLILRSMKGWTDRLSTISFLLRTRTATLVADKQALARLVVQSDFSRFVQDKTELLEFIEHMSRAFGSDWLSSSAIAEMIRQCLEIDKLQTVSDILEFAHVNNIRVENESSILLVDAVRRTQNLQDCIALFKAVVSVRDTREVNASVELVFKMAWKSHMPNMCRVLWHHAATHGSISYSMQKYIFRSLAYNNRSTSAENTEYPQNLLAAITIGVDIATDDFRIKFPKLYETGEARHALEHLCQWTPNDGIRHEQHQLMHSILEDDLTAWKSHQPMPVKDLLYLLDKAYTLDVQWNKEDYISGHSTADIFRQAIQVKLEPVPSEQRRQIQEMIDKTAGSQTVPPVIASAVTPTPIKHATDSEYPSIIADTSHESSDSVESELDMKKSYSLMSSSTSSSLFFGSPAIAAIAMPNSSALDILFQHLKQAWETV